MRKVVGNEIDSASPRISTRPGLGSETERNFSRSVWMLKRPAESGAGMQRKDSSGLMASCVAERTPYLSQLK